MSIKLMAQLWDNDDPELSGPRLLIMLCLADHANDDGLCWPSLDRLAARSRVDKRNAMRYLDYLERDGYLQIKRGRGRSHTHVYHVYPDKDPNRAKGGNSTTIIDAELKGGNFTIKGGNSTTIANGKGGNFTTEKVVILPPEPSVNHQGEKEPSMEPSISRKGKGHPSDPNLKHPAVVAYRDICHLTPAITVRQDIVDTVTDVEHWKVTLHTYLRKGWNPRNIDGQLDCYRNGFRKRSNGTGPKLDPKLEALRMLEEEDPSG